VRPEPLAVELADIKRRLGADDLLADRLRCALYVDLFLANNGLPELFSAREYQALGCAQFPVSTLVGASR
jgi:para-nitrobenzyl esterase